jgi:hypothetical protein
MAEDVITIELEFDTMKECKEVSGIFYNLRAARRREAEWPSDDDLLQQVGAICEKAKQLLLTPIQGTKEEKSWLMEEIRSNKKDEFEFQWSIMSSEGAWVESSRIVHLFEPDDFPYKSRKIMRVSWMWNRCYLITASIMIKMFKELGAVNVKSSVSYENN